MTLGRTFAYALLLETKTAERQQYLAGVALFEVEENVGGRARLAARDNLRHLSELTALRPELPGSSRMLDATLHVAADGIEPVVEAFMPNMLGRPQDWFFPPLPHSVDDSRSEGYTVDRGSFMKRIPEWDKQNRGYFRWEVKAASFNGSRLALQDRRDFRTSDRSQELVGSVQIEFDRSSGLMSTRVFRGTYTLLGRKSETSLRIDRLSDEQVRQLQP